MDMRLVYVERRRDRNKNKGGICMYIRNDISFSYRNDVESDGLEVLWCDIVLPKFKSIVVRACYRSPKQNDFI